MDALGVTKGTVRSGLPMKVRWFWPKLVNCTPTLLRFRKSVPKTPGAQRFFKPESSIYMSLGTAQWQK